MENVTPSGTTENDGPASSQLERQILAVFLGLIVVLGTVGNMIVILAVLLSHKLRTKMNLFVVNLSFADFLTSLHLVWIIVAFLSEDGWPLPDELCVWCGFVLITCIGASVYTLACIAINRLVLIRYGQAAYRILCRPVIMIGMIATIWTIPLFMASIPLIADFGELGYSSRYRTCLKNHAHKYAKAYDILLSLTYYPVSTAVIIFSYFKVFLYLRSRVKKLAPGVAEATVSSVMQETELRNRQGQQEARPNLRVRLDKRQVQVTKNMFYVVCLFFMCTTPYGLTLLCDQQVCLRLASYAAVILSLNSCINPVVYATKHPDFKLVIRCILMCRWKKIPQRVKFFGDS
ncbi:melatonin receptor type 1B-like [Patiria miniata]|uniref:G-protein coupled receptors family 1 profile domain-containing protein n=1 Tax=Patiria miniata TaxID=46514 RepID=A0A913ZTI8_PATMI|nr:melatonin receptor type 1B-like [Patiria miniata]